MNFSISLQPTRCAFCGTLGNATEVYPANFGAEDFNPEVFSARRLPDRLHYRLVQCDTCSLLRSDPIADPELLKQLYARSAQTYDQEVGNLQNTYGRYLAQLDQYDARRGSLLEIGCGSGFFLEEAKRQGYADLWGVEPSQAAAAHAIPELRRNIVCDVLRSGLFPDSKFDVICMFQVFDHLPDPNGALEVCLGILKEGGLILALNHDASSLSARLLGERSPIIDIEHTYLYDRRTMSAIFRKHGFQVLKVGSVLNRYSVPYLWRLMPLPLRLKSSLLEFAGRTELGRLGLTVPLGNLFLIARKSTGT